MEKQTMNDRIQLTDAEIAGVSGGILNQSISISATQSNSADVSQTSTATNNGSVSASLSSSGGAGGLTGGNAGGGGSTVAAAGAESSNTSLLVQKNSISASNHQSFNLSISASDNLMLWPISFWADRR
jgi:hypothetical protein